jgi:hypothetical protein
MTQNTSSSVEVKNTWKCNWITPYVLNFVSSNFQAAGIWIPTTHQDGDGIQLDKIICPTTVRFIEAHSEGLILTKKTNLWINNIVYLILA